ncbi:type II secretion system minor pseudopilin GspI [Parvularcula marina]|uniref:type II secretion system minor pseudopilin GspI n=1 Tax=Parvularcula marina TaxID=2292771 RepID=UPI0035197525
MHQSERGLTLIEVLVAILILGTAVASLLALTGQQTRNADALRENMLARIAAENVMVATMLAEDRNQRDDQGTAEIAGRSYDWQVIRREGPLEGLDILTVEISDPAQGGRVLATMGTLNPETGP